MHLLNRYQVMHMMVLLTAALSSARAFTPYTPTAGWTYYLEAARQQDWPACANRFMASDSRDPKVSLSSSANGAAEFTLEVSNTHDGAFYLKLSNGKYLSYAEACGELQVDTWPAAGSNQEFRLVHGSAPYEWSLEGLGRTSCTNAKTVTFDYKDCDSRALTMSSGDTRRSVTFRLHAVRDNNPRRYNKKPNSARSCADPFAWHSSNTKGYALMCTGGNLALFTSANISKDAVFAPAGDVLGGRIPGWCSSGNRWAPENIEFQGGHNAVFFSDNAPNKHRVGWAMSKASGSALSGTWNKYSSSPMDLGNSQGGEIDQHIFRDTDGKMYLLWKTDDNSVGSRTTRLWGQEIEISPDRVKQVGKITELMESSGLWWVQSFISGGSLVEGPELVHHGHYYYLFFAAGKYCQDSYSEGVARAKTIWGPYEKMPVPLLSTGLTGYTNGQKQVGPGHASFVTTPGGRYFAVYHASPGENCNRFAFVEEMKFDETSNWPYIDFDSDSGDKSTAVVMQDRYVDFNTTTIHHASRSGPLPRSEDEARHVM